MKLKILNTLLIIPVIFTFVGMPFFVLALGPGDPDNAIVPCGYDGAHGPTVQGKATLGQMNGQLDPNERCTFNDFIRTVGRLVNGTIIVISAYAAVSFMYAGYAYLTSGGNQEKISYAKQLFWKVFLGYIIILCAWAFIFMIERALYTDDPIKRPNSFLNSGEPSGAP